MRKFALLGLPLLFVSGCSATDLSVLPEVVPHHTPVHAHAGIQPQHPRSVFRGYRARAVVEPDPWKEKNADPTNWRSQNVTPAAAKEPES